MEKLKEISFRLLFVLPTLIYIIIFLWAKLTPDKENPKDIAYNRGYEEGYMQAKKDFGHDIENNYDDIVDDISDMYKFAPEEAAAVLENYMAEESHLDNDIVNAIYGLQRYQWLVWELISEYSY